MRKVDCHKSKRTQAMASAKVGKDLEYQAEERVETAGETPKNERPE